MSEQKDNPDQLTSEHVQSAGGVGAAPRQRGRSSQRDREDAQAQGAETQASFWAWFYSLDLALWLLGLVVVAMAIGSIIPQHAMPAQYEHAFGAVLGRLIARSSLTHVFSAWWFALLFVLLAANLAGCVIRRLGVIARLERAATAPVGSAQVSPQGGSGAWTLGLAPAAAYERLADALRRRGYHTTQVEAESPRETALRARRGRSRLWGPVIVHSGLVIVLLGAAYGRLPSLAFDRAADITAGDTYQVQMGDRSFGIRLLDAGTEVGPTGAPSQYWARTEVLQEGKVVRAFTISPNHPLRYHGTNVVLNSIASAPSYAVEVRKGESVGYVPVVLSGGQVDMMGTVTPLTDPPWIAFIHDFNPSWCQHMDDSPGGQEPTDECDHQPAAKVFIDESGTLSHKWHAIGWVTAAGADYKDVHFELVAAHGSTQVQLGVHRDPGVPVVWAGFGLIVLGCLAAFFVTRREIAATLAPRGEQRTKIEVGARAFGFGANAQNMVDQLGADLGARQEDRT